MPCWYNRPIIPAEDKIHAPVKNALLKDGWTITAELFVIELEGDFLYADIGAERTEADRQVRMIVVEVKSFGQRSLVYALEEALRQYHLYQRVLSVTNPEVKLYLSLPLAAYEKLQQRSSFRLLLRLRDLSLIVVDTGNGGDRIMD